jgi:hypothetical protein
MFRRRDVLLHAAPRRIPLKFGVEQRHSRSLTTLIAL